MNLNSSNHEGEEKTDFNYTQVNPKYEFIKSEIESLTKVLFLDTRINTSNFRHRALAAANTIGIKNIDCIADFIFKYSIPCPKEMKNLSLCSWLNSTHLSIFEILYNFKDSSIKLLCTLSFEYADSPQLLALKTLSRLANEGVKTDYIIDIIFKNINLFSHENFYYAMNCFAKINSPKTVQKIESILKIKFNNKDEVSETLFLLNLLTNINNPINYLNYLDYLKHIALIFIPIDWNNNLSTHTMNSIHNSYHEKLKIQAALIYHKINNADFEINNLLLFLKINHPNEKLRRDLKKLVFI